VKKQSVYQVHSRGALVEEYDTFKQAFRHWQTLSAGGDKSAFVSRVLSLSKGRVRRER
jgi:hypothetical protein